MKRALRLQPKARAPFTPSRRLVLRGLLGGLAVSVALPPLLSLGSRRARAADDGFPLRFGLFTWGNGNLPDRWVPTQEGEGDAWSLSEQLAGLALVKPDLTVITGLSCKVPNIVPHGSGNAGMLSGLALDRLAHRRGGRRLVACCERGDSAAHELCHARVHARARRRRRGA